MNTTSTHSHFDLAGRRALITGASRGIGQAIAVGLVGAGVDVVGAARSADGLEMTAKLAADGPGTFRYQTVDLRDPDNVEACVTDAAATLGGLDILVNNAADDHDSPIEATELSTYQRILDLNLQSCWVMTRAASPYLKDGGGSVINIASVLGLVGMRDDSCYVAAKHGLVGLTKGVALEWARSGVRVNAICPGFVQTAMIPDVDNDEAVASYIRKQVPMGRWSQPEEFVAATIFLASDASSYMTGQTLVMDGGITAK
jgi:NAD(P)-dependent dehydrogenase (short-subunit alcohol dehydrogenase family)